MQDSPHTRIAIFASGEGSNAEKIMRYFNNKNSITVCLLVCNRKNAAVFDKASKANVKAVYLPKNAFYESNMALDVLNENKVDFIVLSGFLLKIPDNIVKNYSNKIINIHPALLPKFGGAGMYGLHVHTAVKQANEKETGISIHLVNEEYDKGKILFQAKCPVNENDSVENIQKKVQELEHKHFAECIYNYINAYEIQH